MDLKLFRIEPDKTPAKTIQVLDYATHLKKERNDKQNNHSMYLWGEDSPHRSTLIRSALENARQMVQDIQEMIQQCMYNGPVWTLNRSEI